MIHRLSRRGSGTFAVLVVAVVLACAAHAQEAKKDVAGEHNTTELAKQTQNPVANLISVPFQNNFNFGAGCEQKMV